MDDIAGKISELLSSPDGMDRIKQMAGALFSDSNREEPSPSSQQTGTEPSPEAAPPAADGDGGDMLGSLLGGLTGGGLSLPDGFDPMKMIGLISALSSGGDDKRAGLLLALKPHLSKERQIRVDKAVKLLKIASLLPVLKEQGLLDIL